MLIKTYKEANQSQSSCISLPTATVLVVTNVANQVQARDMHLLCVACVCYPTRARQNRVQQCVHMPVFEVLHALNVQAHACTCTHV